jgi:hypothetical protein
VRKYPTLDKCEQPPWLADAISPSAIAGRVTMIPQERRLVIGFGALSGLCRFVEIRGAHRAPISRTITRVAQIFSNSLQLIDKFERDPLTGLHNRQSFDNRFDDLIECHRKNPNRKSIRLVSSTMPTTRSTTRRIMGAIKSSVMLLRSTLNRECSSPSIQQQILTYSLRSDLR